MTTRRGFLKVLSAIPAAAVIPAIAEKNDPLIVWSGGVTPRSEFLARGKDVQKYIARALSTFSEIDGKDYFSYRGGMTWIDTDAALRDILQAQQRHWLKSA